MSLTLMEIKKWKEQLGLTYSQLLPTTSLELDEGRGGTVTDCGQPHLQSLDVHRGSYGLD